MPARIHGCQASALGGLKSRRFAVQPRELQRGSANALLSAVAAALGIRCFDPCLDVLSWKPIPAKSPGMSWSMVPHAVVDFSRRGFVRLGRALGRDGVLSSVWSAMDGGSITLKELNGRTPLPPHCAA